MHIVLELLKPLSSKQNESILNKTGFDTDTELDYSHSCFDDLAYNYMQFIGDEESPEKAIYSAYFELMLISADLPTVDIYIDDGSAAGVRPKDHHPDCLWATPLVSVEPDGVRAYWGCDCGWDDYKIEKGE